MGASRRSLCTTDDLTGLFRKNIRSSAIARKPTSNHRGAEAAPLNDRIVISEHRPRDTQIRIDDVALAS